MIKPRRLRPGDRVALVAPASPFQRSEFDLGVAELQRLGFVPTYEESVFDRLGYVAGTPQTRADALRSALRDPATAGVVAVRGGYGSAQILPLLDAGEIRQAAKPIVGYSDVTALLTFVTGHCGVVSFHGPMIEGRLARGEAAYDRSSLERALCQAAPMGEYDVPGVEVLRTGEFAGPILGGTVTQLLASLATPFAFDPPRGHVLFFDEVAERPYRLDRMITQLTQAGLLARAGAVIVGEMPRCDEPGGETSARAVMANLLADFPGPVLFGFPSGHTVGPAHTVPFGVRVRVIAQQSTARVIVEEPAVQ
ncbi:MAG: LD-carboxypeptidase [Vicinamibacterales bacterium]